MFNKLKGSFLGKKRNPDQLELTAVRNDRLDDSHDSKTEAITFAEAGEHQLILETNCLTNHERPKILMVGNEDMFTGRVVDCTIGLAERFGYDIIAMNVNTVAEYTGKFLSPFQKHLREEFEMHASEAFSNAQRKVARKRHSLPTCSEVR